MNDLPTYGVTPMAAKLYPAANGHFDTFRWLGDIDDHGKW